MPLPWSKRTSVSATTKRLSGSSGPSVGKLHRRLELRDVVVREVADGGRVERLGLLERHEPVARADEGMTSEAPLLDRLEQEARRGALA